MNQSIKILSQDFEALTQTSSYVSMIYTKSFHSVGDFEFVIHRESQGANKVQKGVIVALDKNKAGIVRHREIQLDQNGKITENWLYKGDTLKGLMKQRKVVPPENQAQDKITGSAETVMKHYVKNNFVVPYPIRDPINGALEDPQDRVLENLVIAPDQGRGEQITWQSRGKKVSDELEEISIVTGLGWDVTLDVENNKFVFDVVEGLDLTEDNTDNNSPVYFSPEFGNVKSQSFSDSDINMRNVGYVAGQGEGENRRFVKVGNAKGIDRFEEFIDARDIGEESMTESEETTLLESRGNQKINELKNELFFEAEIMTPVSKTTFSRDQTFMSHYQTTSQQTKSTKMVSPFKYEIDYNLGDKVTVMNKEWGFIVDQKITEFTEVHEASGFKLDATFGQKRPTFIDKVKDEFKQYENELKR